MDFTWIDFRFSQWKSISWVTWKGYSPFFFDSYYVHSSIVTREGNPRLASTPTGSRGRTRATRRSSAGNFAATRPTTRGSRPAQEKPVRKNTELEKDTRAAHVSHFYSSKQVFSHHAQTQTRDIEHTAFSAFQLLQPSQPSPQTLLEIRHIPARDNTSKSNKKLSRTVNSHPIVARFW